GEEAPRKTEALLRTRAQGPLRAADALRSLLSFRIRSSRLAAQLENRHVERADRGRTQPRSQCHVLKLAGMLEQYVSANGWDLRDLILDAAALSTKSESRTQLAVYLMRKEAGLPEPKVAAYFELSPGEIYSIQKRADVQNRELDAKFRGSLTRALDLIRARICPEL